MQYTGLLCENTWIKNFLKLMHESGIIIEDRLDDFSLLREMYHSLTMHFSPGLREGIITSAEWNTVN